MIENAGLTEWPVPLLGRFDEAFLDVPPEVIQLTARVNQKYFVCEKRRQARQRLRLHRQYRAPPTAARRSSTATARCSPRGYPMRASSGSRTRRCRWPSRPKKLERITFHEKLGTVADKVERVAKLARWLVEEGIVSSSPSRSDGEGDRAQRGGGAPPSAAGAAATSPSSLRDDREELADLAEQAARLCKADLVTEMVGEFPELQGLMGGYYARAEGLPDAVADAIRDHYKPVGQGDDVPTAPVTVAVSLADKLDTHRGFLRD